MSKVSVIFKVYPEEGSLEAVSNSIKVMNPKDLKTEDLAFGIKVVRAMFIFDDTQMRSSTLEDSLRKIKGVSEVEVEQETLI